MIKLFITDLDGCLSYPFEPPAWELLGSIRELNRKSLNDETIPPLSICSGRPLPYVEAVAQLLDVRVPVVFESGGMYELASNRIFQNGTFDEEAQESINTLKQWLRDVIITRFPDGMLEFTKMMDAGFVHPKAEAVKEAFPVIKKFVEERYPRFEVHRTDVSVNIILTENNKRAGIGKICHKLGIKPEEVAYIGDSGGDIPALEIVGRSFAPSNANVQVKEIVDEVISKEATRAVLEAYRRVIEMNRF